MRDRFVAHLVARCELPHDLRGIHQSAAIADEALYAPALDTGNPTQPPDPPP